MKPQVLLNKQLGNYIIKQHLGNDGLAEIFKGIQAGLDRDVLIKVLPPEKASNKKLLQRFKLESQLISRFNHPNIITVYDSGEDKGLHYYVMEYVKSESLEDKLKKKKRLSTRSAVKICKDILKALEYIHNKGVCHCNLRPSIIRFDMRDNAIISNFSNLLELGSRTPTSAAPTSSIDTRRLPPERKKGAEADQRSDIYQLGLILYEMLTGQLPKKLPPPPPSSVNAKLPKELDSIVLKALAPDPEGRYQSASEMLEDLKKWERRHKALSLSREGVSSIATRAMKRRGTATSNLKTVATRAEAVQLLPWYHRAASAVLGRPPSRQEMTTLTAAVAVMAVVIIGGMGYLLKERLFKPKLRLVEHVTYEGTRSVKLLWRSNAECYSFVEYYSDNPSRMKRTRANSTPSTRFDVKLEDLKPETTYHYRFVFTYTPGDEKSYVRSKLRKTTTRAEIHIENIVVLPKSREVTISWTTNIETNTKVRYGRDMKYPSEVEIPDMQNETSHSITIAGLNPQTTYHFQIVANDPTHPDVEVCSPEQTFTTLPPQAERKSDKPVVELAKRYIDKLTLMTPTERTRLESNIKKFVIDELTLEQKKKLLKEKTTAKNFADRLRFLNVWRESLEKQGISTNLRPNIVGILQTLRETSEKRTYRKLDRLIRKLAGLDPLLKKE